MKLQELLEAEEIINYAETYEIVTPESAEHGEADERGFIDENATADYEEMVSILQGTEPSNWPPSLENAKGTWYTNSEYDEDFQTGGRESRSYHGKTARDSELMFKAWQEGNGNRR